MVECATDNPTRTVAAIRHHFTRAGGSLGTTGAIAFMFEHKGVLRLPRKSVTDLDSFELEMIDHGLEDLMHDENDVYIYTSFHDFGKMQKALEEREIEVISAELQFIPTTTKELSEPEAKEVKDLLEQLEEEDDVQSVFHTLADTH
jgi:transcriptional/translational regulatory protein YebC/TACO1